MHLRLLLWNKRRVARSDNGHNGRRAVDDKTQTKKAND